VLRTLLGVESIQNDILQAILEKIPDLVENYKAEERAIKTIFSQLRWLDNVYDSDFFYKKLFEVFEVCPADVQKEIIVALPEIVNDSVHCEIAEELLSLLRQNPEDLISSIIYSLCQLNIPESQKEGILEALFGLLEHAKFQDLPCIIKFLITSSTKSTIDKVIEEFRNIFKNLGNHSRKGSGDDVILIVDSFRDSLKYQKLFIPHFLKYISSSDNSVIFNFIK
jgi:Fanconi anemia group D2 protein